MLLDHYPLWIGHLIYPHNTYSSVKNHNGSDRNPHNLFTIKTKIIETQLVKQKEEHFHK